MKILIADGNKKIRKFIREIIADHECEIIEANDGVEAIECFQLHRPEIVLVDLTIENIDGIEIAEFIRKSSPKTKIIITTDSYNSLLLEKVSSAGVCLHKGSLFMLNAILKNCYA